uniref:BSD domain-containing protein n=1 Tax=Kalanchoe fedtschenkoi TaxID=63787 RepID=A0A7N0UM75_KALFE
MAWLARSIADSLRVDDGGVDRLEDEQERAQSGDHNQPAGSESALNEAENDGEGDDYDDDGDATRGVQEDLAELKQTLTRQFWGVASLLAPPPPPPAPPLPRLEADLDRKHPEYGGVREDEGEGEGEGEVSVCGEEEGLGLDSNGGELLRSGGKSGEEAAAEEVWDVVGITEEVLTFGKNIAMHPETWLDYPIEEEDDPDDFVLTTDQLEHTYAVEYLSPRLAALRIELCPAHMSEGYFWKVYFVLLHSRLEKQDAEILSTPQVMAARSLWMKELQKQTQERAWITRDTSHSREHSHSAYDHHVTTSYYDSHSSSLPYRTCEHTSTECVVEKHPIPITETQFVDKIIIVDKTMIESSDKNSQPGLSVKLLIEDEEDDEDDWLKDENINTSIPIWEEEEVSFSDLEEDEDLLPLKPKPVSKDLDSSRQYL